MVKNAVEFLSHPSVASAPVDKRLAFLKRKGLNSAEIDVAVARAGTTAVTATSNTPNNNNNSVTNVCIYLFVVFVG